MEHRVWGVEFTRDTAIEKLMTHRTWRKHRVYPKGPHREVKAECRGRDRTWAYAFSRVHGESALGFPGSG